MSTERRVRDSEGDRPDAGTTRRDLLRSAGVGAALTAGAVALTGTAARAATDGGQGGAGAAGTTAFGFIGRIDQDGNDFVGYGYLIDVAGIPEDVLFGTQIDRPESSVPLTIAGTATLERRSIRGPLFVLDASGILTIYRLSTPGVSFDDPSSFEAGTVVARYTVALHNVLNVTGPNEGIATLTGDLRQTAATTFTLNGTRHRIGARGTRLVLDGTGHGIRTDAATPQSFIDIAVTVRVA